MGDFIRCVYVFKPYKACKELKVVGTFIRCAYIFKPYKAYKELKVVGTFIRCVYVFKPYKAYKELKVGTRMPLMYCNTDFDGFLKYK